MPDPFHIPPRFIPKFSAYSWLDLKHREWDNVEFLPNGWKRVPYERHADLFAKNPNHDFIEVDGLTLCTQNVAAEAKKQGLDWNVASNIAAEFEKSFADHTRVLGLIPISDVAGLQPLPGVEVVSTRGRPRG